MRLLQKGSDNNNNNNNNIVIMEYSKQSGGYQNVALAEDRDDGRSSTEVDESVLGDEKHWRGDRHHHPDCRHHSHEAESTTRKYMTRFRRYRWIVDTLLLCVNISLSLLLVRDFWREKSVSTIQVGGDVTGLGPECAYSSASHSGMRGYEALNSSSAISSPDQDHQVQCGSGLRAQRHVQVLLQRDDRPMEHHAARYVPSAARP